MSIFIWILLALVYVVMLITLGLTTVRKGHTLLFFAGLFIPLIWIAGAVLPPTNAASTAAARANLR